MSGEFSDKTKKILAKRAGEMCTICKKITSKPHSNPKEFINLGEAAHIYGQNKGNNNRFSPKLSKTQIKAVNNGLWLCPKCHKEIDSDEFKYTPTLLIQLKAEHEKEISNNKYDMPRNELEEKIELLEKLIEEKQKSLSLVERLLETETREYTTELNFLKTELKQQQEEFNQLFEDIHVSLFHNSYSEYKNIINLLYKGEYDKIDNLLDEFKIEKEATELKKVLITKSNLIIIKADIEIKRGNLNTAEKLFIKSLNIFEHFHNINRYSRFLLSNNKFNEALKMLGRGLSITTVSRELTSIYVTMGNLYLAQIKPKLALSSYKKALAIYNENKSEYFDDIGVIFGNMALCFDSNRDYNNAILAQLKAIRFSKDVSLVKSYINLGNSLINRKSYRCALKSYKKSITLCQELKFESDSIFISLKIAHGGIGNIYYQLDELDNALKAFLEAEKAINLYKNKQSQEYLSELANLYHDIAVIYHCKQEFSSAILYYKKSLNIEKNNLSKNPFQYEKNRTISYFNLALLMFQTDDDKNTAFQLISKSKELLIKNLGFDLHKDVINQINLVSSILTQNKST